MNSDQAFERLLGHEGMDVKLVNESSYASRSRIFRGNVDGIGVRCTGAISAGRRGFHRAYERAELWMLRRRLRSSGLRERPVQRALHPRQARAVSGYATAGAQERGRLCGVWRADRSQRRLGDVPAALPTSALRGAEGCGNRCIRLQVRSLRWSFPSSGVRLSSPRRQAWFAERDVCQQIGQYACEGVVEMHPSVRQLPSPGASR